MMKITGLSHLFKWENLHNWWLTKYFFAPLYISVTKGERQQQVLVLTISAECIDLVQTRPECRMFCYY